MPTAKFPVAQTLQPFVDSGQLIGAVTLIATVDKLLQVDTVGLADREAGAPMKPDTLFWIASTTKPMTSAALMMLVDEGKVRMDAPVEEYLPHFRGQQIILEQDGDRVVLGKPKRPITVGQVMSHTSGLPGKSRIEGAIDAMSLREAAICYALTPLNDEPGTVYKYVNSGINTAARIIEVLSGQKYEDFMQTRLFDPLGMTETTFYPTTAKLKRLAKTYRPNEGKTAFAEAPIGQMSYPLDRPDRHPSAGGGLFSTAADVTKFGQMLLNGGTINGRRYVSETALRQSTGTQTGSLLFKDGEEKGYGYGFETTRPPNATGPVLPGECGHGGAYGNKLWLDPKTGRVLVYMIQHAGWLTEPGNQPWTEFKKVAQAE